VTPKQPIAMYGMDAFEAIEAGGILQEILSIIDGCDSGVRARLLCLLAKKDLHPMARQQALLAQAMERHNRMAPAPDALGNVVGGIFGR